MNSIINWYRRNHEAITWFLIGWMSFAFLIDFSRGEWLQCLFDMFIIAINIIFVKR